MPKCFSSTTYFVFQKYLTTRVQIYREVWVSADAIIVRRSTDNWETRMFTLIHKSQLHAFSTTGFCAKSKPASKKYIEIYFNSKSLYYKLRQARVDKCTKLKFRTL